MTANLARSLDFTCLRVIVPFEDGCVASVLVLQMFTNGFAALNRATRY